MYLAYAVRCKACVNLRFGARRFFIPATYSSGKVFRTIFPHQIHGATPKAAACHARARTGADTDWERIVSLYETLARLTPSPVVELNRAVAVSFARGPAAGLELVDALTAEPSLRNYHLLPSVRGDLLSKMGRADEARVELERAASLTRNVRERELLLARAAALSGH